MNRFPARRAAGFSLLEMLLVVAVIGILMGMLGASAYSARQRAYVTLAQSEAQQIATAFKSYWLAKDRWPEGFDKPVVSGGSGVSDEEDKDWKPLTRGNLKILMGGDSDGIVYLNVPPDRFAGETDESPFLDPWGHPYQVCIESPRQTIISDTLEGAVTFPNLMRHYYEDGVYNRSADERDWDAYN